MTRPWSGLVGSLRETTVRSALQAGTWALLGTFVGRVATVGALLLAARRLGSADFGQLSLALSTALVVASVSALGLPVAAQKLVAEARLVDGDRRDQLIGATLRLALLVGVTMTAAFLAAAPLIATAVLDEQALTPLLLVAAAMVLLTPGVEVLAGLLVAMERFRAVAVLRALQGCLAGLLIAVVLLAAPRVLPAMGALVAADAITCLVGLCLLRSSRSSGSRQSRRLLPSTPIVKALLKVSLPALVGSVSLQPALWLGQVMLSRTPGGLADVGAFAVAQRWYAIALFVPATMCSVLLPMLGRLRATGRSLDAHNLFVRYGGLTLAFSILACLFLVIMSGPLMGLQGEEYLRATAVLTVLGVAVVPTAMNNVLSQRAVAEGRMVLWMWSDLALALTLVVASIMLVPAFGGVGLALSFLLAYVATCVVLLPIVQTGRRGA